MNAPIRVERIDGAVLVSIDPTDAMVELTARELTVTLSPRAADALAMDLADAAEARTERGA
jgi:hypothetical protein